MLLLPQETLYTCWMTPVNLLLIQRQPSWQRGCRTSPTSTQPAGGWVMLIHADGISLVASFNCRSHPYLNPANPTPSLQLSLCFSVSHPFLSIYPSPYRCVQSAHENTLYINIICLSYLQTHNITHTHTHTHTVWLLCFCLFFGSTMLCHPHTF